MNPIIQIHNDMCGFREVKPEKLQPGNIVTFYNGVHTEIVTKVNNYDSTLIDDGFCSVGAGRGSIDDFGKEFCDWRIKSWNSRDIENTNNKYHEI